MAQRFGGKFSPDGAPASQKPKRSTFHNAKRSRVGARVNLLFFAPIPLAIRAFFHEPAGLALNLLAFGALILAAWLTREGLLAQEAYEARKIARRPAIPRKLFGSILIGIGIYIAGFADGGGVFTPVILAMVGAVLHGFAFGLDPMRDKGAEGVDQFQSDRVARVIDEAEKHLTGMSDAIKRAGDRQLENRVTRFQATAREMFRTVEEDPRDLTAARKYLGVYLKGARDATVKFADLYDRTGDARARDAYEDLLNDLEENFAARTRALLLDDRSDLDVEIEVLRERLAREGVQLS
ncbi:5-bromo-4-chloroindolyl phosphate hydrolysis family protein [Cochlodiniinecator piscidefendens]|uniref:5-bromo-4-chloroindolyl phosphate hydrolysis family protein n=1 Tax=Cochlodiniinecator piscidefendens TaxID=2715756 RepID=UPI00140B15EE|nr:5-bromo-4-chloroindolyl phosphate hydrolysis family protein [Cochlodiniinecator piscidefendens]